MTIKDSRGEGIIVTGGGTGGHLMPAIALCEILIEHGYKPTLLTDTRCINYLPENLKFPVEIFDLIRPNSFLNFFKFLLSFGKGLYSSMSLISKNKAKLVIACGGYSSGPILVASIVKFVPFILQEQNAIVGRVNYFFGYFAKKIFISFMHTTNLPLISSKRIVWAPMPLLRKHHEIKKKSAEILDNNVTILVTGGSQGAAFFDEMITESILLVARQLNDLKFKIIQQSSNNSAKVQEKYQKAGIEAIVKKFFYNIEEYYNEADLFLGRSGASTVNEVIEYGLPAIFIPYPFAANNHQYYNAKNLVEFNAAWVVLQKDITTQKLASSVIEIIKSQELRLKAKENLSRIRVDSSQIIIDNIKKLIDKAI